MYFQNTQELSQFAEMVKNNGILAVDTEFMSGKTYYAHLCLIQIASGGKAGIIDPLLLSDLNPFINLLIDTDIVKIFHSAYQDMELLSRLCSTPPSPVFDTQIAATLVGLPSQIGYSKLVQEMMGVQLDKSETYTDWFKRPLTAEQVTYALNDVLYLEPIYQKMHDELTTKGRLHWLDEDFAALSAVDTYDAPVAEAYKKIKRATSLNRRQMAVLRSVAGWRETQARKKNLPKQWIMKDEALIEIARRKPINQETLEDIRGVSLPSHGKVADQLLQAVQEGLSVPDADLPELPDRGPKNLADDSIVKLMGVLVRNRSAEHGIAVSLLASAQDLESLAAGERGHNPLLQGWRKAMIGDALLKLLRGELSLRVQGDAVVVDDVTK